MRCTKPNILLVDDDENDRMFVTAAFLTIGVSTVYSVESGETAPLILIPISSLPI